MISHSLQETEKIAGEILNKLADSAQSSVSDSATVVGLSGNLGSGKTTFTQAVARLLGVNETVTSPTFVIMKIYPIEKVGQCPWSNLVHIDAYRLEEGRELQVLNFEKIVADPRNLVLLEWPENVKEILPADMKTVRFETVNEMDRSIKFVSDANK